MRFFRLQKYIIYIILIAQICYSSDVTGTAGMQFLKIGADARANALAGAVVSEVDGVDSIYWNPAGLASLEGMNVMGTYNAWIAGMSYIYLGFGMPLPLGKLGASVTFLSEGSLSEVSEGSITSIEGMESYDMAVNAAWGLSIGEMILAGAALRFITKKVFEDQSTGGVLDLGGQFKLPVQGLKAGLMVRNLGFASAVGAVPDGMPITFQVGAGYTMDMADASSLVGLVSFDYMLDDDPLLNIGAEYGFRDIASIRVGYGFSLGGGNPLGGAKGFTVGIGGHVDLIRADVSWVPMGDLGNSIQTTISAEF